MKVSFIQQVTLTGLTLAVSVLSQYPNLVVNAQQISTTASTLSSQPVLVAAATSPSSFVGEAGHTVMGEARIVEDAGRRYLEFDSDFRSDRGPDLFVLLHREAVPTTYADSDYANLGRLQRVAGTQRYEIPADVDIDAFSSAVIWCREFDVTFGYASF
ncbi:MAG: DM13 domain-containing protein [Cyanobacteria bacterium P01_D01_bin.105]